MLRKKLALTSLAVVILCTGGLALAKAVRVDLVVTGAESGAAGRAILNFAKGTGVTQVQINCRGLTPGAEYAVFFDCGGGILEKVGTGTFTVRGNGTGNFHAAVKGDHSARRVAIGDTNGWQMVLASPS